MVNQTSPDIAMFSYIATDCFNACLLDIIIAQTPSRQLEEVNNSKTPKPLFHFKVKGNLQRNSIFKVKILKTQFLAELANRFTVYRP